MEALKQELDHTVRAKEDEEDHVLLFKKQLEDAEQLVGSLRKQVSELELLVAQQNNENAAAHAEMQALNGRFAEATRREASASELIEQLEKDAREKEQEVAF
jgi:chromosome segregation ATPase